MLPQGRTWGWGKVCRGNSSDNTVPSGTVSPPCCASAVINAGGGFSWMLSRIEFQIHVERSDSSVLSNVAWLYVRSNVYVSYVNGVFKGVFFLSVQVI